MKKGKVQSSHATLKSQTSVIHTREELVLPPLDELKVCVKNLRVPGMECCPYNVAITFFDQLLLNEPIVPIGSRDPDDEDPYYNYMIGGTMGFDPSDHTKMCLFADNPLIGETEMCVSKRMEPMIEPTALQLKSWDNLPLIKLKLRIVRNQQNKTHHSILNAANLMRLTVIAAYNVIVPPEKSCDYVISSKIRLSNAESSGIEMYKHVVPHLKRFSVTNFYPIWESISWGDLFRKSDEKVSFGINDVQHNENINLNHYFEHKNQTSKNTVVWGSFHRSLLLRKDEEALKTHLRRYLWPIELQIHRNDGIHSFMGFMDFFKLLYPGETTVRLAVPLHWAEANMMMERCGCELLLSHEKTPRSTMASSVHNPTKDTAGNGSLNTDSTQPSLQTGANEGPSFILVEVKLKRPLVEPAVPPFIPQWEIQKMLSEKKDVKRMCTGRGQHKAEWRDTVSRAANSLRRLPHFGTVEFCTLNRQLSETRTRVELTTSFWQDAAVYVNNNFVVQDFLDSRETFQEMIMMAHSCLVREASKALLGAEPGAESTLRAARHARQTQHVPLATNLYLQLVAENQNNPDSWRELATCMIDKDVDLARVCINEAVLLDPRHPLTLLSKASMLYEEDPESAEVFFTAILELHPFWTTGWVAAYAFYSERQEFLMADAIKSCIHHTRAKGLAQDLAPHRGWETELGDWWYPPPIMPVTSLLLEAAELLLRLRGMPLAEVCLALDLASHGANPTQSHLVALACRLRGDIGNALCHLNGAFETFGEGNHLRSLQAECYLKLNNHNAAVIAFEKAGNCLNAHGILSSLPCCEPQRVRGVLVELLRHQPSSHAWMALADDWLMRQAAAGQLGGAGDAVAEEAMSHCAAACAEQALRWNRRCARAWRLLAQLAHPKARRAYCKKMAMASAVHEEKTDVDLQTACSQQSMCHLLGKALRECHCNLCETSNKFDCTHLECECVKSVLV